ncbi:MAG: hypothetical protein RLY21_1852 [Planctomycetota bacterium]|jgi:RNA polymerase sigma factor (sigma-70 family)
MQPIVRSSPTPTAPDWGRRLVLVRANGSEPCSFRDPIRYLGTVADDDRSDSELVNRALCGDNAAWSAIVDRYGGLAFALARRAGLSRSDAEDVAQSVFTTLVRSLATLRDGESLAGWIATSVRRAAWRASRQSRAMRGSDALDVAGPVETEAGGADEVSAVERRTLVLRALGSIDERCQHLLQALFLGASEPDYHTIGQRFGIAPNSVGPIRNRCLRRLLEALERLGFEPSSLGILVESTENPRTNPPRDAS